jgi:WD40 repeat protein
MGRGGGQRNPRLHENIVTSVVFSPEGAQVLTGAWDKIARLWDAATGKAIRAEHSGSIAIRRWRKNSRGTASSARSSGRRQILWCYSACNFDPLSWGIGVQN